MEIRREEERNGYKYEEWGNEEEQLKEGGREEGIDVDRKWDEEREGERNK